MISLPLCQKINKRQVLDYEKQKGLQHVFKGQELSIPDPVVTWGQEWYDLPPGVAMTLSPIITNVIAYVPSDSH